MNILVSLVLVLGLAVLAAAGASALGLQALFGVALPLIAIVLFLGGFAWKVRGWASSPVPFRIPTTCGQQKTHPWIKNSNLENPHNIVGVIGRMALEVLFFRSLFRNTKMQLIKEGPRVVYGPNKWLWAGALVFHYSLLVVLLRHLRLFTEPVPFFVGWLQWADGFIQYGVPIVYLTTVGFLVGVTYLFLRRVVSPQLRYISLINDYFPLFLLLCIGLSGMLMRHFIKTDIVAVKELTSGLLTFNPHAVGGLHWLFYVHLFLVTVLFAYFPFSKLMHLGGVFMSPTRNLANNSRFVRHVNPWNPKVKIHTYEEYEDDFREWMVKVGLPVDKPLEEKADDAAPPPPAAEASKADEAPSSS